MDKIKKDKFKGNNIKRATKSDKLQKDKIQNVPNQVHPISVDN